MTILKKINAEINTARKSFNKERLLTLTYLKSLILNNSILKNPLKESEVIFSHYKKMKKSKDSFSGKHLEKLLVELKVIEEFLPKIYSAEELSLIIDKYLYLGSIGPIIKKVKLEVGESFDGQLVSSLIRSKINKK